MRHTAEIAGTTTEKKKLSGWTRVAPFLVIGAGICWGLIGLFSRKLSAFALTSIQITEIRCFVAGCAVLLYLLLFDREKLKIQFRDIWMFLGTGILSIAFFNICYFYCIMQTSLSVACILLYTAPCFVMIMSCIFFKEKFTLKKGTALFLAMIGCVLITGIFSQGDTALSIMGILTGIGSGIGYALYSIFGRVALKRYTPVTVTVYTFMITALFLLPMAGIPKIIHTLSSNPGLPFTAILLGLISTLLPFCLYTKGLQHMETSKASILTFVEPMVATLIGILIFKEAFTFPMGIGMIAIVLSLVMLNI